MNYFSFLAHRQIFHDFLRIFLDILRHIEAQTLVMIVFPSGFDERTAVTAADLQQKQPQGLVLSRYCFSRWRKNAIFARLIPNN